jgi:hypothetical protein
LSRNVNQGAAIRDEMAGDNDKKAVREQLDRIFRSGPFVHSPRRQRF